VRVLRLYNPRCGEVTLGADTVLRERHTAMRGRNTGLTLALRGSSGRGILTGGGGKNGMTYTIAGKSVGLEQCGLMKILGIIE